MRHLVNVIGIATIHPITAKISHMHLKKITIVDQEMIDEQQLAAALADCIEKYDSLASFKRGWSQAMQGEALPISTLWDELDDF